MLARQAATNALHRIYPNPGTNTRSESGESRSSAAIALDRQTVHDFGNERGKNPIELPESIHASDDRLLLSDYVGIRQRNTEHSRERIGRFSGCGPPTTRGGSKRSDADRIRAKDGCLCDDIRVVNHRTRMPTAPKHSSLDLCVAVCYSHLVWAQKVRIF